MAVFTYPRSIYLVHDLPVSGVVRRYHWKLSDIAVGMLQRAGTASGSLCGNDVSVPGKGSARHFKIGCLDHYPVYGIIICFAADK